MIKLQLFSLFLLILAQNSLTKKSKNAAPRKLAISLAHDYFQAIQTLKIKQLEKIVEFPIRYYFGEKCARTYPKIVGNWTLSSENIQKNLDRMKKMNGLEFRPKMVVNAKWIEENGNRILQWESAKQEMHKDQENIMVSQFHAKKFHGKMKIFEFGSVC
ncbi:unnamed protein product [Caenorhabditis angaria]|uniref:Nuclear transport factor 2 family protein n=1 Tax=Caenorhabditis angaria TaxID=860376 RepID=A0A9P1N4C7_9PELO|nr:unnamed protein product [Caenorhabditis angaria]